MATQLTYLRRYSSKPIMYWKIVGVSFLAIFMQHVIHVVFMLGSHRVVFNHLPGPCRQLEEIVGGSKDVNNLPNGLTFISSILESDGVSKGVIYMMNLSDTNTAVTELMFSEGFDQTTFYPDGVGVFYDSNMDIVTLFVINHHPKWDRIEKFQYNTEILTLQHISTIVDDTIHNANNIVAVTDNTFYFTNKFYSRSRIAMWGEMFFLLPWGSLVYFDGDRGQMLDRALVPNGVAISPDKKYLYLTTTLGEEFRVYKRITETSLDPVTTIPLYSSLEGMTVDIESGDVWLAAGLSMYHTQIHASDHRQLCASRVFRLQMEEGNITSITEVYSNDGKQISASSSVLYHQGKLLIGSDMLKPVICTVHAM